MARSNELRRLTRQLAAAGAPVSEECKRLIALIRQRCPGLIPPDPLPTGKEGPEIPLAKDDVQRLVSTAAVAGGPATVIWTLNDSELIVIAAKVQVVLATGLFLVRIPVSCAEIKSATIEVAFATGHDEQPAGMLCATEERPRGPAAIVDVWHDALIAYAWDIVLTVSAAVAGETGTDEDGAGLIPSALSVNADGLRLKTMARHGFESGDEMSLSAGDLGEVGTLAKALGLVDAGGDFRDDWLSRPGDYLSSVLADNGQRDAMVAFVDEALGGEDRNEDADGLTWLPIVSHDDPKITLYVVLDERPADFIGIGVGARLTTGPTAAPTSRTSAYVPIFRAARSGKSVSNAILIGTPDAIIRLETEVVLGTEPPLRGLGLVVRVPTAAGPAPEFALSLRGLQLPGAPQARDLTLSVSDLDQLDDAALELVLGLVKAQADAIGGGPLESLVRLLGLETGGPVPSLPIAALPVEGASALASWFESVVSDAAARAAWLGHLASLLGGAVSGDEVRLSLGAAQLTLGIRAATGTGSHTILTPFLGVAVNAGADVRVRADADLLSIDLASGSATALPRLATYLHIGKRSDGGSRILTGDPQVDAFRAGFSLDASRRPTFVLAADGVTIAGHTYATLDLSTPDAIANVAGTVLNTVLDELLAELGAVGPAIKLLLGLDAPPSAPGVPTVEIAAFLRDPLGTIGAYWRGLVRDHASAIPDLLTVVRDIVADNTVGAISVQGSGTFEDPWRVALVGRIELLVWRANGGDVLELALGARASSDTLGLGCTQAELALSVGLASLDLATPGVSFLSSVDARLTARAKGETRAVLELGPFTVTADHLGAGASWRPGRALDVRLLAPNLIVEADAVDVPIVLPAISADGSVALDAAGWDALEQLAGLLAGEAPIPWVADLAAAFGWTLDAPDAIADGRPHLRLAALAADPSAAIVNWLATLAVDERGRVRDALRAAAQILTGGIGRFGSLAGTGTANDPYRLPLLPVERSPELALWLVPDGPQRPLSTAPDALREWRPGYAALSAEDLAEALFFEAESDPAVAALVSGRPDLAAGLTTLAVRWSGTDGRIVPPTDDPVGVTVHRLENVTLAELARTDLTAFVETAPATIVRIAVVAQGASLPWPAVPAGRLIDLRAAGLAPEAFAQATAAAGEWFVALAGRVESRLVAGDPDGVLGQAARLGRVLAPFSTLADRVVLVAHDAAGHAALAAANEPALAFVDAVVTLGTAFTPVAFTIVDDQPAADVLRLLRWLIPPIDPDESDDQDLATGRGLLDALASLRLADDPGRELRPPATPLAPPRAGLAVHAVFGVVEADAVARALTAIIAAGLAGRARRRVDLGVPIPTGARLGLRLPVAAGAIGVTVSGHATVELTGVDIASSGPTLSSARALAVHLELRRTNGWLVGGPDPGRGPGPRAEHEVRWIEVNLRLPLGSGDADADIVLHEPRVFSIERPRWVVRAGGASGIDGDAVTPALPEVRVLLSLAADALASAAPTTPPVSALLDILRGLGIIAPQGGVIADAVDRLLFDTASHVTTSLGDSGSVNVVANGVTQLLTGVPGVTIDLAARRLVFDLAGTPGDLGMLAWTAHVEASGGGSVAARVTVGSAGSTIAGGAVATFDTNPLSVAIDWTRPGASQPDRIAVWPTFDLAAFGRAAVRLAPAECLRLALEYPRGFDGSTRTIVDAVLDAVGLLGAPSVDGQRAVLLPAGLLADPAGWFGHAAAFGAGGGFSGARVAAFLDAVKPLADVAGGPGEWQLGSGVVVRADSVGGQLRLGLQLDTSSLAPIPTAAGRVVAGGTFALEFPAGRAPRPTMELSVGLAGAAPGRRAVHVAIDPSLRVFVRPDTGADLSLYPDPPGLGQLADAAVTKALPFLLDRLAAETGANLAGRVGAIVRAVGDGLNLRTESPLRFNGDRLHAWADDPAAALRAALPTLTATALDAIADAAAPLLPAGASATVVGGELRVAVSTVTLAWMPSPFRVSVGGAGSGIPFVESVTFAVDLDATGLKGFSAAVGPGAIDAGGVTLRPFITTVVGQAPAGGRRIELGLSEDATRTRAVAARWALDGAGLSLVAFADASESSAPADVALALLDAVLDLVASFAIATDAVGDLLDNPVGATTVREVLRGVLLDQANPNALDDNLFDPDRLLNRVRQLAVNLADAEPSIDVGGGLSIGAARNASNVIELTLGVTGRIPLNQGDVVVSIEADSRWIRDQPPAGLALGILNANTLAFAPGLSVNGLGLRISKSSGPLLDVGLTLGSIAVHVFGAVQAGSPASGGVQLQLSDLAVGVAGAQGGNPVAQGLMTDAGKGPNKLAPSFSPALAVQKHGAGPVLVSLSAGEGSGPWWLAIQKGFGPIYIEQVGFGVTVEQEQLKKISLLLDGRVSLFGLTAAVDDLQLTFVIASNANVFDPSRWAVDLAGLAVSADLGGIYLAGGLRKFGDGDNVEYVGMLIARFAVYGLTVYGGYGTAVVNGERFAAFFAFGAINGPIGGPPAFFITGIGGGFGINRGLVFPADMSTFGEYPFIKALDPGAKPSDDPMAELTRLRDYFPMVRGQFWFAAGISFNSFALVDGIAVVAVSIGDGLEIALLGLARMALPRPQFALVSIELGLIARFSSREGVLWVQAQLTDNSWILNESVRLTGGFAFVTWFAGPNAGQFVLTMGGFHPRFHRDGYPNVPRLGFRWSVSDDIVIKGENYFALTSEALMAGGELSASAEFGSAWAHVVFGANAIVYFDPFWFEVEVYAKISAGVTIDVWIGEITISISIGARIVVSGPEFHGKATFEVGPIDLTVEFGGDKPPEKQKISWGAFVRKYLEESAPDVARVVTSIPGKGSLPPGTRAGGTTETGTADGSAQKPFEVLPEFEITITTTVPCRKVLIGATETTHTPSRALGLAPMGIADAATRLELHLRDSGGKDWLASVIEHGDLIREVRNTGAFPVGVWGAPQPEDDRKVPKGDVIAAVEGVRLEARAELEDSLPKPVRYNQLDPPGPRKPLPFVSIEAERPAFLAKAGELGALLPPAPGGDATFAAARPWLVRGGHSKTAVASLQRDRSAPPRLGSLSQGLATKELGRPAVTFPTAAPRPPVDVVVRPPRAIAILASEVRPERPLARTTLADAAGAVRVPTPTLAAVEARRLLAVPAKLVRIPTTASRGETTVVATGAVPLTRNARGAVAAVAARGSDTEGRSRLDAMTGGFGGSQGAVESTNRLSAGEIAVLDLPNASRDLDAVAARPALRVTEGVARLVALSHAGEVLFDSLGTPNGTPVPIGTERIAVLAIGTMAPPLNGLIGWHSGQQLAYVGWSSALVAGAVVRSEGASVSRTRQRFRAGWIGGAEFVDGTTIVATRFVGPITSVGIVLDDPVGSDAGRGLSMTVDGADRAVGAGGEPIPPEVVVLGNRSVLVYALTPAPIGTSSRLRPVTISVASQPGWHLAGVVGGFDTVAATVDRLVRNGLDAVVQPLVPSLGGAVQVTWAAAVAGPTPGPAPGRRPVPRPVPRPPRKRKAPKRKAPKKAPTKKAPTKKAPKKAPTPKTTPKPRPGGPKRAPARSPGKKNARASAPAASRARKPVRKAAASGRTTTKKSSPRRSPAVAARARRSPKRKG